MRVLSPLFALALIAASLLLTSTPASANHGTLSGTVTDISTGQPVANVCVTIGPPVRCATNTKADGTYFVDLAGAPDGLKWDLAFFISGVKKADFPGTVVNGPTVVNAQIDASGFVTPPACGPLNAATPTATNYLPNITKTLGGSTGWQTPFIVQNITRRFFGFVTPIIIQNLGAATTTATAQFVARGGGAPSQSIIRVIDPGRSQFIDPNSSAGLIDGTAYAVTVTADQPIAVVVNTHHDDSFVAQPVAYSADGIATGATTVYAPYFAKNASRVGVSTAVVQNVGTAAATPSLKFTPLGGGTATTLGLRTGNPGKSAPFDPPPTHGNTTQPLCGAIASTGCLADGEYSVEISAGGGSVAAAISVIGAASAMGYTALSLASPKYFLPNVTRTLGGATG